MSDAAETCFERDGEFCADCLRGDPLRAHGPVHAIYRAALALLRRPDVDEGARARSLRVYKLAKPPCCRPAGGA